MRKRDKQHSWCVGWQWKWFLFRALLFLFVVIDFFVCTLFNRTIKLPTTIKKQKKNVRPIIHFPTLQISSSDIWFIQSRHMKCCTYQVCEKGEEEDDEKVMTGTSASVRINRLKIAKQMNHNLWPTVNNLFIASITVFFMYANSCNQPRQTK